MPMLRAATRTLIRRERSTLADDLLRERLQRLPVVRPFPERDAEPHAPERSELLDHRPRVLHGPAQVAGALGTLPAAEMALELLLAARDASGVGAEIEAEIHRPHDRLRIPAFLLAPRR